MTKKVGLEINTLQVKINTLTLDGKRFTKSVFDQLPECFPIHATPVLIGFVKYTEPNRKPTNGNPSRYYIGRWGLYTIDGILYKRRDDDLYKISLEDFHELLLLEDSKQIFISI